MKSEALCFGGREGGDFTYVYIHYNLIIFRNNGCSTSIVGNGKSTVMSSIFLVAAECLITENWPPDAMVSSRFNNNKHIQYTYFLFFIFYFKIKMLYLSVSNLKDKNIAKILKFFLVSPYF